MRINRLLCGLAIAGLATGFVAHKTWAGPLPLTQRAPFTAIVAFTASVAGDCGPLGPMALGTGIDATSPFFMFDLDIQGAKQTYTYRPRNDDCGTCNVAYFGDGQIAAVEDFRTLFERWKRSSHPVVGPPPVPLCANVFAFGGANQCSAPCHSPITITPRDMMFSPVAPGTGGAVLFVVLNPLTNAFEDYKFEYSVWN
jgi:hypothetical protein